MYVDMHCDTLYELRRRRRAGTGRASLADAGLRVNLEKMRGADCLLQNFAVYIDLEETEEPFQDAMELVRFFQEELEKNRQTIRQVVRAEEIEENRRQGRMSALLTLEEGGMCGGETEKLHTFYECGARMMTLCWNYENELAYPAALGPDAGGLKEKGFVFLEEMERLGMIPDVSHLSDRGFYDVARVCRGPFAASHSNARGLCAHVRNLTDDMLRLLGEKGGVAGLNFYPLFLSEDWRKEDGLEWIVRHARRMMDKGGTGCVGLGSDFDGFSGACVPEDASGFAELAWAFHRAGFSEAEIEGIFWKNVLRLYREVLK